MNRRSLAASALISVLLCIFFLRSIGGGSAADARPQAAGNNNDDGAGEPDGDDVLAQDEDGASMEDYEPAPRTALGPYNDYVPGRKYFIYSPSGGWNNQRECLENAMEIGKLLNRTVYVPMAGKHTQFWRG